MRPRSASRELQRPREDCVCGWETGDFWSLGVTLRRVQRSGAPPPAAAQSLAFWGGRVASFSAHPLLSLFPSDSESPRASLPQDLWFLFGLCRPICVRSSLPPGPKASAVRVQALLPPERLKAFSARGAQPRWRGCHCHLSRDSPTLSSR